MKRIFTFVAITITAAAAIALLAAFPFKPAQAATFPGLTLIYFAAGAMDSPGFGTSVPCINQSGKTATVRWRFLNHLNQERGSVTVSVPHGRMVIGSTLHGTYLWHDDSPSAATEFQGKVIVLSTQSAVFCTAVAGTSAGPDLAVELKMIRFNAHPGTVE